MLDISEILSFKNLYLSIFESAQVPMVVLDEQFKLWKFNSAFCRFVDRCPEELSQINLFQLLQSNEAELNVQNLKALKSSTIDLSPYEIVAHRKDGALTFGEIYLSRLKDKAGVLIGFIGTIKDITHIKKVESELVESQIKYSTLVENSLAGINLFDVEKQKSLYANQKFLEIFKMDKDDLNTSYFLSYAPEYQPDGRTSKETFQELSQRVIKEGSCTFDWHARGLDGNDLMLEIHASSLPAPNEHINSLVVMDVTEKRLAEQLLRESEEKFRSIYEQSPLGIVMGHKEGELLANQAFLEFLGYSREEFDHLKIADFSHPGDEVLFMKQLQKLHNQQIAFFNLEKRYIRKDGNLVWANVFCSPLRTIEGKFNTYIAVIENIDAVQKAEQALKESEEKFRGIYEQSPIGIVFYDEEKRMIANQKFREITGYSIDELKQMDFIDISYQEEGNAENEYMTQLLDCKIKHFNFEQRYVKKDGSLIWGNVTVSKLDLSGKDNSTVFILFEDITEKKKAIERERELTQIKQRELITAAENNTLRGKLEIANRELSSNLMFIAEQKSLLNSLNQSLKEISSKVSSDVKHELFKVSSKVKNSIQLDQSWNKFKFHFDQIHPQFFVKLQKINTSLTQKELKQCAYLKIGLSNKEVAQLLGVSPKSIEMAKYRIKKKLDLGPKDSLNHFILSI